MTAKSAITSQLKRLAELEAENRRLQAERDQLVAAFPLRWTDEKPTEPGRYWFRNDPNAKETICWVYRIKPDGLLLWSDGRWELVLEYIESQWAGPIPLPIEPEVSTRVPADDDVDSIAEQYGEERFDEP